MGGQGLLLLIGIIVSLTTKHCYFRHSRPPENFKAIASVVYLVCVTKHGEDSV